MPIFRVIVGNIGAVYIGSDYRKAVSTFKDYKIQSQANCGRAAGESVTLLEDDEPINEFNGKVGKD